VEVQNYNFIDFVFIYHVIDTDFKNQFTNIRYYYQKKIKFYRNYDNF